MYAVEVRDRIMIAHSLPDEAFGPARHLHGATYVVDVAFFRKALTAQAVVVDIGAAQQALRAALAPLAYQNLDTLAPFAGRLTTTEYLCRHIFDTLAAAVHAGDLGADALDLAAIRVTLHESDVARAWFEGPLR